MVDSHPTSLGHHFAEFLAARSGLSGDDLEVFRDIVLRLGTSLEDGHSCLVVDDREAGLLQSLDLVGSTSSDSRAVPLVIDGSHLYLHRYYHYESRLAKQLQRLAQQKSRSGIEEDACDQKYKELLDGLDRLFGSDDNEVGGAEKDYQKEAARLALNQQLVIVSGGPGTGKTHTVVKILALLIKAGSERVKIGLAAPTGKAAMRLSESIARSIENLPLAQELRKYIPTTATTLHRMLGVRRFSPQFQYHQNNPLPWDIVVIDEASMVDLALMSKLVDGLRPEARLILLGDSDQLTSVESGKVLSDCIESLPANSIRLRKSFRFDLNIKRLATAANRGEFEEFWKVLQDPLVENVSRLQEQLLPFAASRYTSYMSLARKVSAKKSIEEHDIQILFAEFYAFQLLCAVHFGERGVVAVNQGVEHGLRQRGYDCYPNTWYPGRPILITKNDYRLDLYNGDIGICLPDNSGAGFKVWFERAGGPSVKFSPARLSNYETVFAMTIHKSQGSEFGEVVVVLPGDDSRILTRELVYTGVTRAKDAVRMVAERQIFETALSRKIQRISGLKRLLTGGAVDGG